MTTKNLNGWKPEHADGRDRSYRELRSKMKMKLGLFSRPRAKYLKDDNLPRVYNQGDIGSCVGHGCVTAAGFAVDFNDPRSRYDGTKPKDYSRLYAYYNARRDKANDTGAYIRDGVKGIAALGLCEEKHWPYVESNYAVKPPQAAYADAAHRRAISYFRLDNIEEIIDCVAQGYPVVFGMTIYPGFMETDLDGNFPMPTSREAPIGGHCMVIVGYSMKRKAFYVRNSWGEGWGQRGNVWVPFSYLDAFGDDFWTIRTMTAERKVA